jgi:hypothetical protein
VQIYAGWKQVTGSTERFRELQKMVKEENRTTDACIEFEKENSAKCQLSSSKYMP